MKIRNSILLLLIMASLFNIHCGRGPAGSVGSSAPEFQLSDLRGQQVSLAQYRGKIVILDFWATWCGPCRMSMPLLERLQKEYPNDLKLLAINLGEPVDQVRDFVSRQNFNSTVLMDSEGSVGQIYRSESIPMQVVIDNKGVVSYVHVGFSPRMAEQLRGEIEKLRSN